MSLEKALADNTAALEELNDTIKTLTKNQSVALKSTKGAPAADEDDEPPARGRSKKVVDEDDEPPARGRSKKVVDEDDEPPARGRSKKVVDEDDEPPARGKKAAKAKKTDIATVQKAFAAFLDVSSIKDAKKAKAEEKARRTFLNDMFDHLDVDKATDIAEEDFEKVIGWVDTFAEGDEVDFEAE